jgi:hypothetical protein
MRLLATAPQDWFGRPLRQVLDADMARWAACVKTAKAIIRE